MEPQKLKTDFGSRICFHGSIDTQYLLPQGSAHDVSKKVREMFEILGKDGGFILSPSHILQTDVPIENIQALYSTGSQCTY
jgi:uroporphyrinogen-III decarboxylase